MGAGPIRPCFGRVTRPRAQYCDPSAPFNMTAIEDLLPELQVPRAQHPRSHAPARRAAPEPTNVHARTRKSRTRARAGQAYWPSLVSPDQVCAARERASGKGKA